MLTWTAGIAVIVPTANEMAPVNIAIKIDTDDSEMHSDILTSTENVRLVFRQAPVIRNIYSTQIA